MEPIYNGSVKELEGHKVISLPDRGDSYKKVWSFGKDLCDVFQVRPSYCKVKD